MIKKLILVFLVVLPFYSLALTNYKLPSPTGTLEDAKLDLCNRKAVDKTIDKYFEEIMEIEGVDGIGQELLSENKNHLGVKCNAIFIYADMRFKDSIQKKVGATLDGNFVLIGESGGPGSL
jgi:hypothetical protein